MSLGRGHDGNLAGASRFHQIGVETGLFKPFLLL
jgi:hypothetical protein